MDIDSIVDEVHEEMGVEEEDLARHIAKQIAIVDAEPSDVICDWDAFSMKIDEEATKETWERFFEPYLKKKGRRKTMIKPKPKPKEKQSTPIISAPIRKASPIKKRTPIFKRTPIQNSPIVKSTPPSHSTPAILDWEKRPKAGEIVATFNEKLPQSSGKDRPSNLPEVNVEILRSKQESQWLWERIEEVSANQTRRIREIGETFRIDRMMMGDMEVQEGEDFYESLTKPCQNDSYFLGRIWNSNEGVKKMKAGSVCLENMVSEQENEVPACVPLNLAAVENLSLFPGQVVVVRGTNPSGDEIIVQEVFSDFTRSSLRDIPPSAPDSIPLLSEQQCHSQRQGLGLVVEVACGPFSCEDFIGWDQSKPIHSFLKQAKESKPDALILCGPFVDEENKVLHTCERTYLDEFVYFLQSLRKYLEDNMMAETTIIFVPSVRDAFHQPNFPQWAFDESFFFDDPKKTWMQFDSLPWHFAPNPAQFSINHISFGISSLDCLMQLNKCHFSRSKEAAKNRLHLLAKNFIEQQSFHPIFPAQKDVHVDWINQDAFDLKWTPDIFLIPSPLRQFATKISDDCIFVNSGTLARKKSGGTFTRIHVPFTDGPRIQDKIRVDVIRV